MNQNNKSENKQSRLDVEAVIGILSPTGPLADSLKGFESRYEQSSMMRNVLDAYNHNQIALIEAGTGTGKSIAYLIPALLWAVQTKERTVISTNTITLQEQLLHKDIPLLTKALHLDVQTVLVKGMQNYLCLRKFDEVQQEVLLLAPQEARELDAVEAWKENTQDGSRSDLPFTPSYTLWEKLSAENDTCGRTSCPYYQKCYFFKARREAQDAQILIVNHNLLFSDLVYRAENDVGKEGGILPNYTRVILDEAHNIENIATDYFASMTSQLDILKVMARLTAEKGGKSQGKLHLLKAKLAQVNRKDHTPAMVSIQNRLTIDFPGIRKDLLAHTHEVFTLFSNFTKMIQNMPQHSDDSMAGEHKLRVFPYHQEHPDWQGRLIPGVKQLVESMKCYEQSLKALIEDIKQLNNSTIDEQVKGLVFEINALAQRLNMYATSIESFTVEKIAMNKVRWIETQALKLMINITLVDAQLDIAKTLAECLFSKFATVILCSATLTTDNGFNFIRNRLGLIPEYMKNRAIKENVYHSPFNFSNQALFLIPTDIPAPSDPQFISVASEKILAALIASRGNAFVLFTSYTMLKTCFDILEKRLRENGCHPLKQGDDDRLLLLKKFKTIDRSVLFGTDSFWEGVDVAGEALRCVVIVKLPFKVPTDPLIQARSEVIAAQGGDPFMEYSLPQAIVKFKQGIGRLIRNQRDRGCIVCLDNRITTKRYGQHFLNSLPKCPQVFVAGDAMQKSMVEFYRRTQFLTQNTP